ncbi:MAG: hypothetical protein WCV85_01550 [Patescibacteria group bacterium]
MSEQFESHYQQSEVQTSTDAASARVVEQVEQVAEEHVEQTRQALFERLPELAAQLSEQEVRTLAAVGEKDAGTFTHLMDVAETVQQHMPMLQKILATEKLPSEALAKAALFHDVGKLGLPTRLVQGTVGEQALQTRLAVLLEDPDGDTTFLDERLRALGQLPSWKNANALTPEQKGKLSSRARELLTLAQYFGGDPEALAECRAYGLDPEQTSFMDALHTHEAQTKEILENLGYAPDDPVAAVAGTHHNYSDELRHYPLSTAFLEIVDMYEALTQERTYQAGRSSLEALHTIMQAPKGDPFHRRMRAKFVREKLKELDFSTVTAREHELLDAIERGITREPDL